MCKYLINMGADVNAQDINKTTPLHLILLYSLDIKFVKLFLKNGADYTLKDNSGYTPIHKLFFEPTYEEYSHLPFDFTYDLIIPRFNTFLRPTNKTKAQKYLIELIRNGLNLEFLPGRNLISYLIRNNFYNTFCHQLILERGYDPNFIDNDYHFDNVHPLVCFCEDFLSNFHLLEYLLIYGADLEIQANNGTVTPINDIQGQQHKKIVKKFNCYQNDFLNLYKTQFLTDLEINGIKINKILVEARIGLDLDEKNIQILEKHPAKYLNWFFEWIYSGFETHYSAYKLKRIKRICYTLGFFKQFKTKSRKVGLQTDLYSLFKDHSKSDFTLIIGNEKLHLHKCVLAARSNLFRELFKFTSGNDEITEIHDYTEKGYGLIKTVIKYLYTDKIRLKDNAKVRLHDLEYIYDYYQLNENSSFKTILYSERKRIMNNKL
ncbi:ankyrin repeat [Anaeramoeba flamelloides]|uniref:Ankyrin repeat domain-containing protein 54 n=1 Tax=Anaeramoeba flamelloides TaxID=1746091 RepID=A0ABQ8XPZ2_9EUKA|nr:ankyrin repeat [Anaeramoeba flamelloides]